MVEVRLGLKGVLVKVKSRNYARRHPKPLGDGFDGRVKQPISERQPAHAEENLRENAHEHTPKKYRSSHLKEQQKLRSEALLGRLDRKRLGFANDNLGRTRRQKTSIRSSARPFGQKVVLFLMCFTFVLIATFFLTILLAQEQVGLAASVGFSIGLACIVSCIPLVDTVAKVVAAFLAAALIGFFSLLFSGP